MTAYRIGDVGNTLSGYAGPIRLGPCYFGYLKIRILLFILFHSYFLKTYELRTLQFGKFQIYDVEFLDMCVGARIGICNCETREKLFTVSRPHGEPKIGRA